MKLDGQIELKKNWKFYAILVVSVLLMILFTTYIVGATNKFYGATEEQESTGVIDEVQEGTKIEQQFIAVENNLEKLMIYFEPYADDRMCGGEAIVGIKDEAGNVIKEEKITRNHIRSASEYQFQFPRQKESKGRQYTFYIHFEDLTGKDKFYTLQMTNANEQKSDRLYINGELQEDSAIIFQSLYLNPSKVSMFCNFLLVLIPLICLVAILIYYKKDMKVENIFLCIVPVVAVLFMITMPTLKNHDEQWHWLKAFEVSEGNLMTPIYENGLQGSLAPKGTRTFTQLNWRSITYGSVKELSEMRLEKEEKEWINPYTSAFYSCVSYLPQAIRN